ncbi:hypothetical protein AMS68_004777 [Peltaster fructicola]|uniref:Uncharacterized protein n=1 Tax=Peltaster fructicola TaxID=286661 RepID=A0A6H0XXW4_9PEZI|nr:hypothetical protein AMS68_004777 [Peltaster fructicola]
MGSTVRYGEDYIRALPGRDKQRVSVWSRRSQARINSQSVTHKNEYIKSGPEMTTTTAEQDTDTTDNSSYSTFATSPPVASDLPVSKIASLKLDPTTIEEMLRRVRSHDTDASDWKGKIHGILDALRDVETILFACTKEHNGPKIDALRVMLDTIITCLVGDRNVHTFMNDEAWIREHSAIE